MYFTITPFLDHKMLHTQSRKFRRHNGGEYGFGSRYEHIMSIAQQIKSSPTDPVPRVGQRLFHNAFKCLIDAVVASQTESTSKLVRCQTKNLTTIMLVS